jgi:hypothetical protein
MTVASDWDDDTWKVHLEGYLSLLQHSCQEDTEASSLQLLEQALQFNRDDRSAKFSFDTATRNDEEKAILLLHVLKLRLKDLVQDYCRLTQNVTRPRKLDMQRLRFLLQRLLDDLGLMTSTSSPLTHIASCTVQLEHAALRVVAGGLLIECGNILDVTGEFDITRDCANLILSTRVAATDIFAATAILFPDLDTCGMVSVTHGRNVCRVAISSAPLSAMWPLFAAGVWSSSCSDIAQQCWAREALYYVGKNYHLPRALHLVCISRCPPPVHF